jgi:hypothetical protein
MTEAHRTGREVGDEGQKEACRPSSTSVIRIAMVEKIQAAGKVCTGGSRFQCQHSECCRSDLGLEGQPGVRACRRLILALETRERLSVNGKVRSTEAWATESKGVFQ